MLCNEYSQLPVMQNERSVKGVISWESIGARLALGTGGKTVRDFMEPHADIGANASLLGAIDTIAARQYVLVRDLTDRISGIVTTSDLSF